MKTKIKIKNNLFASCIAILTFFKPLAINSLSQYQTIDRIWDYGRIGICIIILYNILTRKYIISKSIMYLIGLEVLFLASTILKDGDVSGIVVQIISIVAFSILTYNLMKIDELNYCKSVFYSLSVLIIIHAVFLFLYPNGLGYDKVYYNAIYFLASKNGLIKFLFPAVVSGLLMIQLDKEKTHKIVYIIILLCLYICIKSDSITSAIGIIVCLLFDFISRIKKEKLRIDFQKIFLVTFILCIIGTFIEINGGFIKILNVFIKENKLQNYIDRIYIWKEALQKIIKSPIIGYGMAKGGGHIIINNKPMYAHNGYLEIFLYGGVIGFTFFLLIMKKFLLVKSRYLSRESIIIASGIMGFLIMMMTETHINTISFWAFIIMYDYIINKNIVTRKKS